MLVIEVGGEESYNNDTGEFLTVGGTELRLEHSLASLSKWESIHEKAFIGNEEKTDEEMLSYIKCMSIDGEIPPELFAKIDQAKMDEIADYINAKRSATWFHEQKTTGSTRETITSELIYYWMVSYNIPFECQDWHLNRLLNLIRICGIKNTPPKKMSKSELARRNRELNAQRRASLNSRG